MADVYVPRSKIALASSFEGIVNNGATECALTSLNAYQQMNPGSFFGRTIEAKEFDRFVGTPTVAAFIALRPLVEIASDYHTVLKLLETYPTEVAELLANLNEPRHYDFFADKFREMKSATAADRDAFGKDKKTSLFYVERERMKEADYRAWIGTQRPYPNSIRELRKLVETQVLQGDEVHKAVVAGFVPYFATSKDEASTFDLCRLYTDMGLLGPSDVRDSGVCVISRDRIIGLETTADKLEQMKRIAEKEGLSKDYVFRLNDRYDPEQQTMLADNGFERQLMVTGGYVFPHEVENARKDPLLAVVERENMAAEITRYAEKLGF